MVKENTYVTIQAFMVNELHLKGNELLIYAIIWGFSQDGESEFTGSLQYLADWCNTSKQTVLTALQSLCEKNLILKNVEYKNNLRFCTYKSLMVYKNFEQGGQKSLMGYSKNLNGGGQKSLTNNIYNKLDNKINYSYPEQQRFSKPTLKEIQDYCTERKNKIDAEQFFDYYEAKGWMVGKSLMKDWKACIRNWERKDPVPSEKLQTEKEYYMVCEICGHNFEFSNDWECPQCHSKKIALGEKKKGE